jgi:hypothetical protein
LSSAYSKSRSLAAIAILGLFLLCGAFIYFFQNSGKLPGGSIALPKLLWLGAIIFFWYVAPVLLLRAGTGNSSATTIIKIHLANVWLRAIIELIMMYIGNCWHPIYGIVHDIVSALALATLVVVHKDGIPAFARGFFSVVCLMFLVEAFFAWYMLTHVYASIGPVYFVPALEEFKFILRLTWLVVSALAVYTVYFFNKWLAYGA